MKKSLKLLIASSALVLAGTLLAGCEEKVPVSQIHEHTFSENWEASDSTHWHKATCEHTDVMSNVEDHKFGAWNTEKEPTQDAEGLKSRVCSVCQYRQTAAIAKLDHTHSFSEDWQSDDENHWHVATCHTDVYSNFEKHTYGNWTIEVEPTETIKGLERRECSVCHHVQKQEVDKTLHIHTYASEWSTNETSHWKAATCEHADSFKDFGDHQFGEPVVVPSTETVAGSKTYTCGVCGYVKVETLPLAEHVHSWDSGWSYDGATHWHAATCNCEDANADNLRKDVQDHDYDSWEIVTPSTETVQGTRQRACKVCDYVEVEQLPLKEHEHTYSSQWSKNATEHWHAATCGHTDSRKDVAEHTWGSWVIDNQSNCTTQGTKHRACSVCGYVENAPAELNTTAHSYSSDWTYNESTHWHAATCGHAVKSGEAAHVMNGTYGGWTTPIKCNTCGYVKQAAWKDIDNEIPSDYFDLKPASEYVFKFTLHCDSQIRLAFSGAAINAENVRVYLYNDATGGYFVNTYIMSLTKTTVYSNTVYRYYASSGTHPAGDYHVIIRNARTDGFEKGLCITNYTYEYAKDSGNSFNVTIDGQTSAYKIYQYTALYGVSDSYYTIENASGETVQIYRNITISRPTLTGLGSFSFVNAGGARRTYRLPNYAYRSEDIATSPYYIDETTDSYLCIGVSVNRWEMFGKDPYLKGLNGNMSELEAKLLAKYAEYAVYFEEYSWYYDSDLDDIASPQWGTYCPISDYWNDFSEYIGETTFESTNKEYLYSKTEAGYNIFAYKITNATTDDYARFTYRNATSSTNYDFGGIVLDADFNQVRLGYTVSNGMWFNPTHNYNALDANQDRWSIKPGETYYFIFSTNKQINVTFQRAYYKTILNANNEDVPEDKARYNIYNLFLGQGSNNSTYWYSSAASNSHWDVASLDKEIVGWGKTPGALEYKLSDNFVPSEKKDTDLYACWMDKTDMVYSNQYGGTFSSVSGSLTELTFSNYGITDSDLTIKVGDALSAYCTDGLSYSTKELIVTNLYIAGSEVTEATRASTLNKSFKMKFEGGSGVNIAQVIAITMKREFNITIHEWWNDDEYVDIVDKGDSFTLPKYEDMFDWSVFANDGDLKDDYFAGWEIMKRGGATIETVLDGATIIPTRDLYIEPIYETRAGSNVVALRHDIDFAEVGGVEYLKLQVLDPNLTITTATHFILKFSDGTEAEIGVTQILNVNGVNLPDGAKTTDGEILLNVFNLQTKKPDIQRAVQIIAR